MSFNQKNIFKNFIERIGQISEFKPLKNIMLSLKEESKRDLEKYNYLLERLNTYWKKYKENSEIAYLLEEHYEEIFVYYLSQMFPFRSEALIFEEPEAPTPVDFKIVLKYRYNKAEIEAVEEVMFKLKLKDKTIGILKRLIIFSFASIAPLIEKIFGRPFAAQFNKIEPNKRKELDKGEILITAVISLREQ